MHIRGVEMLLNPAALPSSIMKKRGGKDRTIGIAISVVVIVVVVMLFLKFYGSDETIAGEAIASGGAVSVKSCDLLPSNDGITILTLKSKKEIKSNTCSGDYTKATKYTCDGSKRYKSNQVTCGEDQACLQGRCVDKPFCYLENDGKVMFDATSVNSENSFVNRDTKELYYSNLVYSIRGNNPPGSAPTRIMRQPNGCNDLDNLQFYGSLFYGSIPMSDGAYNSYYDNQLNPGSFSSYEIECSTILSDGTTVKLGCNEKGLRCCKKTTTQQECGILDDGRHYAITHVTTDCGTTIETPRLPCPSGKQCIITSGQGSCE